MAKRQSPSECQHDEPGQLIVAINSLADQVQVLREAIDEFREIFTWAVRSDRLRGEQPERGDRDSDNQPNHSETEQDGEQQESIVAAVQESLSDVCGDLEEAVRDQLKQELAEFRNSLDQFSTDITWAARKVREKPSDELNELRETIQGEIVDLRGSVEQFMTEMHDAVCQIQSAVRKEKQGTLFDPCVTELPKRE